MCSGRQSRPHLFHVVRKVCTKSGHVSTIPPVVKNNSHHGISTIKSDYPQNERDTDNQADRDCDWVHENDHAYADKNACHHFTGTKGTVPPAVIMLGNLPSHFSIALS